MSSPAGWAWASGRLIDDGVSTGAYSATSGPVLRGSTAATGAARGLAWRTFVNDTGMTVTCRVNAVLTGNFGGPAGGTANAFVYAFDPALLDATLSGVAPDIADYLLAADGLNEIAAGGNPLSLTGLFPPEAVLASGFVTLNSGLGDQSAPVNSSFLTLAPDEVVTIMFDVSVYSPGPGSANFANTLTPDPDFFTDESGQPVSGISATGPVIEPDVPPTAVALAPESASAPVGSVQTATATVTDGLGEPVAGALVFFTVTAGPNAGASGPITTDVNGQAAFSYADMGGDAGTDTIEAATGELQSNTASLGWTVPGALDYIAITPSEALVPPDVSVLFTTEAFDRFDNSRGDVTGATGFSIVDGSCVGSSCSATTAGPHTVTADYLGVTATATLTVEADSDDDGLVDSTDNCTQVANPAQLDVDADGIGNVCDGDFTQNCSTNFDDLAVMQAQFFTPGQLNTDMNGDGVTNFGDLDLFKDAFFLPPGPSGIANICN